MLVVDVVDSARARLARDGVGEGVRGELSSCCSGGCSWRCCAA